MSSKLAPLIGHDQTTARLWMAARRQTLHHAYLFEGPAGVGKRTVALRLAMMANCEAEPELRPCASCPTCSQIATGNHPDVVMLSPDPSSATPRIAVDAVREVVRQVGYHRYNARHRFLIVEPAEALPPPSANALLKTLEEPPDGTSFVLIATHASALLPTIVSRCQRVRFSAVPEAELVPWLQARGVPHPERAARLSLGCPGHALELADHLEARAATIDDLMQALRGDTPAVLEWASVVTTGARRDSTQELLNRVELVEDLLRDVVIVGSESREPLLNADREELVRAWTRLLWPAGVTRCHDLLERARAQLQVNVQAKLVAEALMLGLRYELRGR